MSINQSYVAQLSFWTPIQEVQGWLYDGYWMVSTTGWVHGNDLVAVGYNPCCEQYRLLSRTYIYGDLSPWTVGEAITLN